MTQIPDQPTSSSIHEWREVTERVELVERLIASEARVRVLERALREYMEAKRDDPSTGSYVVLLLARVGVLEINQERLLRERERRSA